MIIRVVNYGVIKMEQHSEHLHRDSFNFFFHVCTEKKRGNGEDSFYFCLGDTSSIVGVFDGCGGAGGKKYPAFSNKTGAFLASRIACGSVKDCFEEGLFNQHPQDVANQLKNRINENLKIAKSVIGENKSSIKSKLIKEFPTTIALISSIALSGHIRTTCYWAGDSRCYYLSVDGLYQLTKDDISGFDALDNLSADSVMTNLVSLSKEYEIHNKVFDLPQPGILFVATDGCFSCYSTPMEFEYLLIRSLRCSISANAWEALVESELKQISCDDFTLIGVSYGFDTFQNLQDAFSQRENELRKMHLDEVKDMNPEEKRELWNTYKSAYMHYI